MIPALSASAKIHQNILWSSIIKKKLLFPFSSEQVGWEDRSNPLQTDTCLSFVCCFYFVVVVVFWGVRATMQEARDFFHHCKIQQKNTLTHRYAHTQPSMVEQPSVKERWRRRSRSIYIDRW